MSQDYFKLFFKLFVPKLEELFEEATNREFLGNYLFDKWEQDYYQFSSSEKGDGVCLIRGTTREEPYRIQQIPENRKFVPNPIVPQACPFEHCEEVPGHWLEDYNFEAIKSKAKQGGKSFGEKLNKALVDILLASTPSKSRLPDIELSEALANIYSELVRADFDPSVFLFPKHLKAKLVQRGIIVSDQRVKNEYYVGTTKDGLAAYGLRDFAEDTALILDKSVGVTLWKSSKFELVESRPFTLGICGYISFNPIVKNISGVVAVEGIEKALEQQAMNVLQITATTYVDLDRIKDLRAISSNDFDLSKLIRLCEEINTCYANECYLATTMLVRTLLDHVPPILKYKTFTEVANNYSGGSSFKKSMQNLQNSSRNITDAHLHVTIREKESLPNKTQVNFSNDLDVLLSEIVRVLQLSRNNAVQE